MKNIRIEPSQNNTYFVIADTERFGTNEIMFESYDITGCKQYIINELLTNMYFAKSIKKQDIETILYLMSDNKKEVFSNSCNRTGILTSEYSLSHCELFTDLNNNYYKLSLQGCRSNFSITFKNGLEIRSPKNIEWKSITTDYNYSYSM